MKPNESWWGRGGQKMPTAQSSEMVFFAIRSKLRTTLSIVRFERNVSL